MGKPYVKVICSDGMQVKMDLAFIPRITTFQIITDLHYGGKVPPIIEVDRVKSKMLSKICVWLHHYLVTHLKFFILFLIC